MNFKCRHCSRALDAPDSSGGQFVTCPYCKGSVRVPALAADAAAADLALAAASRARAEAPGTLTLSQLRDAGEVKAYTALALLAIPVYALVGIWVIASFGGALLIIGIGLLARYLAGLFAAAYIKSNAVRVSPRQLPEIYDIVQRCTRRLGCAEPQVYVMQQGVWNAFAARFARTDMVVLFSGAIDSILLKGGIEQLTWLVGHEIGHHYAGHLRFSRRWVHMGGWLPWFLLWYKRRCELTCDRIGLYCSGSLQTSLQAACNMTVGAQLSDRVDVNEAIAQWHQHKREFFVRYRTIYSSHPHHLWRLEELTIAAKELGVPA